MVSRPRSQCICYLRMGIFVGGDGSCRQDVEGCKVGVKSGMGQAGSRIRARNACDGVCFCCFAME